MGSLNVARCILIQIFISFVYIHLIEISVDGDKKVLASFHNHILSSHHLIEVNHESYPKWFSLDDRTLLSKLQRGGPTKPNIIVAKDGSGQFKTVTEGINSYPQNYQGRYIIHVKAGIYTEYITIDESKPHIFMYGDSPTNTIITGHKNSHDGLKTYETATFSSSGHNFIAKSITFENTAGPEGEQAVALYVEGDRSAFFNCVFRGYQDTLYVNNGSQFYRNCEIYGTIDFIFGQSSTTLIQNSMIWVRKPSPGQQNVVVADGTSENNMHTGIVLQNCSIKPDVDLLPYRLMVNTYLARPWKEFSKAVFINNYIGDLIQRDGYMIWNSTQPNTKNSYFAEFGNIGPGANASIRVKWAKGLITKDVAATFTAEPWLNAKTWLPFSGIPYDPGF